MSRVRADGTWIPPRGGANLRCPQCDGLTKVKTSWGGDRQVIRERHCIANPEHRFFSTEAFATWRSAASISKKKPYRIRPRNRIRAERVASHE